MLCQVYTRSYVCLVNEKAEKVVIGDRELLGKHIPTSLDDMITLGELLTVADGSSSGSAGPSE